MRNKKDSETPTKAVTEPPTQAPTKGLSFEHRPGKPAPYLARWREPGGRKKSQSFETEKARAEFAVAWAKRKEQWGRAAPIVHPRAVETWKIFAELTGNTDPLEVARFFVKYRTERGGQLLVEEGVKRFLASRKELNLSRDTKSHVDLHLERFRAAFAKRPLCEMTADLIRSWMDGLINPETGQPMEPYTKVHHLKTVKLLFAQLFAERLVEFDPCLSIKPPKIEVEEISVLAIEDAEKLFRENRDSLCIGRLALEAFGGLRHSSAGRLQRSEILDEERGIVMPGHKHKTGLRHYVDGYPKNLWAWIAHAPSACWQLPPRIYTDLKAAAFTKANVVNPGNVLRHSFCSYHIALHKNADRTAVLLTHRTPGMLYQHYRGKASAADATRYFAITP